MAQLGEPSDSQDERIFNKRVDNVVTKIEEHERQSEAQEKLGNISIIDRLEATFSTQRVWTNILINTVLVS